MANGRFEVCKRITVVLVGSVHKVMNRDQIQRFVGKEPIHMWPYISQFVTQLNDFAHLEVFHDAVSGYVSG